MIPSHYSRYTLTAELDPNVQFPLQDLTNGRDRARDRAEEFVTSPSRTKTAVWISNRPIKDNSGTYTLALIFQRFFMRVNTYLIAQPLQMRIRNVPVAGSFLTFRNSVFYASSHAYELTKPMAICGPPLRRIDTVVMGCRNSVEASKD